MSSATNIALNSRTMSGIILISDGIATLSEGDLNCEDITSNTLLTGSVSTGVITCNGELRTNTVGPYSIPISATSITGSLISYGNVSNSGGTDFTNYGSTYNLLKQGFYFNNINSTTPLTNLAIIDNTQTYFKSQLTGCTAETPLNNTSVANKTYVDTNFMFKTGSVVESITGSKTFTNNTTFNAQATFNNFTPISSVATPTAINHLTRKDYVDTNFVYKTGSVAETITGAKTFQNSTGFNGSINVAANVNCSGNVSATLILSANTIDARNPSVNTPRTLFTNLTTASTITIGTNNTPITINSTSVSINGDTTIANNFISSSQATFNNFTPISNVATPTANNHLSRKDYVDNNFVDKTTTQTIAGDKTYNGNATYNGTGLFCNCPGQFYNLVHLRSYTRVYDIASPFTNYTKLYTSGNNFFVYPEFTSSTIQLFCRNSANNEVQAFSSAAIANTSYVPFIASSTSTFNGQASFNNSCPISTTNATISTHLTTLGFNDGKYVDFASVQSISGIKTFLSAVYLKNEMRIYDIISPFTNYTKLYTNGGAFVIYPDYPGSSIQFYCKTAGNLEVQTFYSFATGNTSAVPFTALSTSTFSGEATFNTWVNLIFRTRIYDLNGLGNFTQMYMLGNALILAPNANGDTIQFYCKDATLGQLQTFTSSALGNTSNVSFTASSTSTFNGQATFNNSCPISSVNPTANNHLTRKDYVDSVVSGSNILSLNNTFTGFNTFSNVNGISIRGTLLLKDSNNVQESSIDLASGLLGIACSVNSGKILLQTKDAGGNAYTRLTADANEINITAPLTLFLDYTYYNPFNFSSTRLGYSMSNTGSTNTLTNNTPNNSGQINIPAGSWTISYTGTITVITGTLTTLNSLEIYVADDLTNDLNIIGVNVINYYQISSVPIGKKMRISGSGTYISYISTNTELNLRLLPLFTGGSGGLNFQGKISATRNA